MGFGLRPIQAGLSRILRPLVFELNTNCRELKWVSLRTVDLIEN